MIFGIRKLELMGYQMLKSLMIDLHLAFMIELTNAKDIQTDTIRCKINIKFSMVIVLGYIKFLRGTLSPES